MNLKKNYFHLSRFDLHILMIPGRVNNELPEAKTAKKWEKSKAWKRSKAWEKSKAWKKWLKKLKKKNIVHSVKKIQLHGGFINTGTSTVLINDIAIITVKEQFKFDSVTRKASLPYRGKFKNGNNIQSFF